MLGVMKLAMLSRAIVVGICVMWVMMGRPYDTSAILNPPSCLSSSSMDDQHLHADHGSRRNSLAHLISTAIQSSVVWDSVHYIRIAECGYEYEHTFAFLPVLPFCIRFLTNYVFFVLVPVLGYRATLALSGYVLNNISFIFAASYLYKITFYVFKDEKFSYRATALFCLNPASIFYSSIYSESLFSLLSFAGMWQYLSGSSWKAVIPFAISSGVRSNGVLHAGYFLFQAMHDIYITVFCLKAPLMGVQILGGTVIKVICVVTPFVAFQAYGYKKFCIDAFVNGYNNTRPWCNTKIPYLYGFVQSTYWDVGFLRYFQLKQLPNFLLASPLLMLAVGSLVTYAKHKPALLFSFGLCESSGMLAKVRHSDKKSKHPKGRVYTSISSRGFSNKLCKPEAKTVASEAATLPKATIEELFFSLETIPFVVQMAFMAVVSTFVMHVQVATRFLSVCPPVYWFAAYVMGSSSIGHSLGYFIWAVSLTYLSLGSLLFVNFYPFT